MHFECFEAALVKRGNLKWPWDLDKRPDMAIAEFTLTGAAEVTQWPLSGEFMLPMDTFFTLHIKYGAGDEAEDEVMFIDVEPARSILPSPFMMDLRFVAHV